MQQCQLECIRIIYTKQTTIRGVVTELIPDYDYTHADKLTLQYMGREKYPFKRADEKRITLKIKPDKVFILPELKIQE